MTRQTIVAANWKMNGDSKLILEMSEALNALTLKNKQVIVCPSAPYLANAVSAFSNQDIAIGAQNANEHDKGAYTGEVSALMLKDLQVQYVILGHSERRAIYGESSELVADKVAHVLGHGLTAILCIGETESERENGETETVLKSQLDPVINKIGIQAFENVVVAYEPVWAIGTGKTASSEIAQQTHEFIRGYLASFDTDIANTTAILYGGSVNAGNCQELFSQADIDGGLIGGASLKIEEFSNICSAE
ncbi:triose-phosphate isomerase [Thalassotalea sp. HSM 43]|uniref:triose-phosphate isomerase n=1 Tax=Thalassotalea sp. HSM 43 TaxID=2552945 RepID=UPI001081C44B|nr:triose-phosphate isomerase [Thalassotalea sp. HSM 43]QBY02944.1 triose-phosphate isomerase [Thalassotalea sp. HSM 43]